MEFENKILSREIQHYLYESGFTIGTAESCTGGRIAEAIISVPGASEYFKGGIISYTDDVKESLLGVSRELLTTRTAVCEEVAIAMISGAIKTLNVDIAVSSTGYGGPGGGDSENPVGTIWIACGNADNVITYKLTEDHGRDINLAIAASKALQLLLKFIEDNKQMFEK